MYNHHNYYESLDRLTKLDDQPLLFILITRSVCSCGNTYYKRYPGQLLNKHYTFYSIIDLEILQGIPLF